MNWRFNGNRFGDGRGQGLGGAFGLPVLDAAFAQDFARELVGDDSGAVGLSHHVGGLAHGDFLGGNVSDIGVGDRGRRRGA